MLLPPFSDRVPSLEHSEPSSPCLNSRVLPRFGGCLDTCRKESKMNASPMPNKTSVLRPFVHTNFKLSTSTDRSDHSSSNLTPQKPDAQQSNTAISNDYQMGVLMQKLDQVKPDQSYFGRLTPSGASHLDQPKQFSTWRQCFMDLVDQQLQAAEDNLVYIPASAIREHIQRLAGSLNDVKSPRLCIPTLQAPTRSNTPKPGSRAKLEDSTELNLMEAGLDNVEDAVSVDSISNDSIILGDIFFSAAFCNPSTTFLRGLGENLASQTQCRSDYSISTRLSMYKAYHAVSRLLQHYSDRSNVDKLCSTSTMLMQAEDEEIEMEARELLTEALNEMASIR